ncbi:hypothetical protein NPIL_40521 [Nephila pilipes]|uniref:Uncharacterized protein n=1 Tax=Nephila pilipes TaxID=299642 RepID=A0A8X6UA58_NEPPI|nr:hypothetical protein NPIL_40521 [Nephila pilipes]
MSFTTLHVFPFETAQKLYRTVFRGSKKISIIVTKGISRCKWWTIEVNGNINSAQDDTETLYETRPGVFHVLMDLYIEVHKDLKDEQTGRKNYASELTS